MEIDSNHQYLQSEIPADVFNSSDGDIRSFNGQQVRVGVNGNGTRSLRPVDTGGDSNNSTFDVNSLYNTAYNSPQIQSANSAITASQAKIDAMNKDVADAEAKVNDNPWISEAERIGRIEKVRQSSAQEVANEQKNLQLLSGNLAGYKTDAENKVNFALKQFDINNQQHQQAVSQLNSLLESGALSNASGGDLANLARSTGMSVSMIQSAIQAARAKNQRTQVIPFNDGENTGYAVINPDTGEIINKQVIAGAAPTKYNQGPGDGNTITDQTKQINLDKKLAPQYAAQDAKNKKMTLGTMMGLYGQYGMSNQQIYNAYMAANVYHPNAAQIKADKKRYGVK